MSYQLDGMDFPQSPITRRFSRERIATRGDGAPIFSGVKILEMEFPILTTAEYAFFSNAYLSGTLHTLQTLDEEYANFVVYSGVAIREVSGVRDRFGAYVFDVRVTFAIPDWK